MNTDIQTLRNNYSRFSDDKIFKLAKEELFQLNEEAVIVLKEEVIKRQLPLIELIKNNLSYQENINALIDGHSDYVRNLPCPICGSEEYLLNAVVVSSVTSYIVFTRHAKDFHIGCPPCLTQKKNSAEGITLAFGWWGFPFGIIETFSGISRNTAAQNIINSGEMSEHLTNLVTYELSNYQGDEAEFREYLSVKIHSLLNS